MEIGNLWLIPVSIFFNFSLYWVQKHYLIKWFCRNFLYDSVQLECDIKSKKTDSDVANGDANGAAAVVSNGYHAKEENHISSSEHTGKKLVTDGEINGCAME